ncbi:MAG TPA: hypothetical protein VFQ51_19055 [Vicinamibacteria bacterium]|nr:hypothetical protein [Vicinamibacteria bacterium]
MTPAQRLLVVVHTDRSVEFSGAVRGKYYERFRGGTNLVLLDPDVAAAFPTSVAVNQALRSLVTASRSLGRASAPRRTSVRRRSLPGKRTVARKR